MARSRSRPRLAISFHATTGSEHVEYLSAMLSEAHGLLRPALREMTVALVGDARMAALHQRFFNVEGTTDVMTFPLDHDPLERVTCGDVMVCVPVAKRHAKSRKTSLEKELLLYALHGMLHLCGFDDTTVASYRIMHHKEDEILTKLGVGAVFDRPRVTGTRAGRK